MNVDSSYKVRTSGARGELYLVRVNIVSDRKTSKKNFGSPHKALDYSPNFMFLETNAT